MKYFQVIISAKAERDIADSIGTNEFVQAIFGRNARHILYKRVAIIYAIREDVVYIDRVIAGSMIH